MSVPLSPSTAGGTPAPQLPHSFVDSKLKVAPEVFHGDQAKWSEWSYIFTSYVHGISLKMGTYMDRCAGHPTLIPTRASSDDVKEMANQLMTMLTTLCRDKALRVIKSFLQVNTEMVSRLGDCFVKNSIPQAVAGVLRF
jgi:hypothetical protein